MKKFLFIAAVSALLLAGSCKKNELSYFDDSYVALNIWLKAGNAVADSVTYNFAYTVLKRDSIMFSARLAGMPADYDRTFRLKAVEGDVDKVQFETQDYVLKAGEYEGSFPIFINKPDGYSEFQNVSGHIVFELEENEYFKPGAVETNRLHIVFKNFLAKPDDWDSAMYPYMPLSRYFGTYSDVKYAFIIQATGYSNFSVYYTMSSDPGLPDNVITSTVADRLKQKCKLALAEYNEQHSEPLTDEFGNLISFPS